VTKAARSMARPATAHAAALTRVRAALTGARETTLRRPRAALGALGLLAGAAVLLAGTLGMASADRPSARPGPGFVASPWPGAASGVTATRTAHAAADGGGLGTGALPAGAVSLDPVDLVGKCLMVGGLLYVTLRVLRRLQGGAGSAGAELVVVESRTLAPKASIHLVAVGNRRMVVGLTQGSITTLADLGDDEARRVPQSRPGLRVVDTRPQAGTRAAW
jgi:flagellar biogenesis protein FliO